MCVYHLFLSTDCILLQYVLQFQLLSIFFSLLYTYGSGVFFSLRTLPFFLGTLFYPLILHCFRVIPIEAPKSRRVSPARDQSQNGMHAMWKEIYGGISAQIFSDVSGVCCRFARCVRSTQDDSAHSLIHIVLSPSRNAIARRMVLTCARRVSSSLSLPIVLGQLPVALTSWCVA